MSAVTLFTIPKPFKGDVGRIQRDAWTSWRRLGVTVLVFGDEEGVEGEAKRNGFHHIPRVGRNAHGTPLIDGIFEDADNRADGDGSRLLCHVNSDIVLFDDFLPAVEAAPGAFPLWNFVLTGARIDVLRFSARELGKRHPGWGMDYHVWPVGFMREVPPFAIGRTSLDNWLVLRALRAGCPVIDASDAVTAVHQHHDYSHIASGGYRDGPETLENQRLYGVGRIPVATLADATHIMTRDRMVIAKEEDAVRSSKWAES